MVRERERGERETKAVCSSKAKEALLFFIWADARWSV
jgi:hypothetical protein